MILILNLDFTFFHVVLLSNLKYNFEFDLTYDLYLDLDHNLVLNLDFICNFHFDLNLVNDLDVEPDLDIDLGLDIDLQIDHDQVFNNNFQLDLDNDRKFCLSICLCRISAQLREVVTQVGRWMGEVSFESKDHLMLCLTQSLIR